MTDTQDYIERAKKVFMNTYPIQPVMPERGDGCALYDREGRRYLDFAAGIAVASLGHNNPVITKAIHEQMHKFMMCPASFVTEARVEAAELLVRGCSMDKVFFCNSGAEAIEAGMKLARAWAHEHKGPECKEFISFANSFHGRTMGAVSITEKARAHPQFGPYLTTHWATFNDLESVKPLLSDKICAIVLEPVQGEGGITPATKEFMQGLRALCDEREIILMLDEVQCGMGRIGYKYAHDYYDVEGDIMTLAKGMGGGFPVGAMLAKEKFASAFKVGMHGTTYGGNPLACAVVRAVVNEIDRPEFLEHVRKTGQMLIDGLKDLQRRSNKIEDVRGLGLMVGVDLSISTKEFLGKLRDNGMLATMAGKNTLRLTPPLTAGEKEVKEALALIEKTLLESA